MVPRWHKRLHLRCICYNNILMKIKQLIKLLRVKVELRIVRWRQRQLFIYIRMTIQNCKHFTSFFFVLLYLGCKVLKCLLNNDFVRWKNIPYNSIDTIIFFILMTVKLQVKIRQIEANVVLGIIVISAFFH